mmetsp:Transcript_19410/g.40666  ORF Transcript_19410/g.40666 Transcript_19410/m.40666 type:complete len:223 (+) Transcript_19410:715-1383(+)
MQYLRHLGMVRGAERPRCQIVRLVVVRHGLVQLAHLGKYAPNARQDAGNNQPASLLVEVLTQYVDRVLKARHGHVELAALRVDHAHDLERRRHFLQCQARSSSHFASALRDGFVNGECLPVQSECVLKLAAAILDVAHAGEGRGDVTARTVPSSIIERLVYSSRLLEFGHGLVELTLLGQYHANVLHGTRDVRMITPKRLLVHGEGLAVLFKLLLYIVQLVI